MLTQASYISFEEACTVFNDPLFITFLEVEHSDDEERYITLGLSLRNRLLLIAHTDTENNIRLISARKAATNLRRDKSQLQPDNSYCPLVPTDGVSLARLPGA